MADKLHILNGDSTHHLFRDSGIAGDVFVWNEILSEGPVVYEVGEEKFWQKRLEFVTEAFGPGASNYRNLIDSSKVLTELKSYEEIVLWYEYDLFCQVNLMAILSWLHRLEATENVTISLICVGQEPGYDRLVGLGQIPVYRYNELFQERKNLSAPSLRYANRVWSAYCSPDPHELVFAQMPHPVFNYLHHAISAHFKRFPFKGNQLSEIEYQIIKIIDEKSPDGVDLVVRDLLQWQQFYGFGDLQYFRYIKFLEPFISFNSPLSLSDEGKSFLSGEKSRSSYKALIYPLGGTSSDEYWWDNEKEELVRSS